MMPQNEIDEDDDIVNLDTFQKQKSVQEDAEDMEGVINLNEYSQSKEAEEATWFDALKEAGVQSAAGLAQAYTWPLDVLKVAMMGEALTDIDDLESAFEKAGKPFDRNKYIQTVMEQGEFLPTQELLQRKIDEKFGTNINEPKTRTGKFFNKLFFLGGLTKGKGITKEGVKKSAKAGITGATTTAALREAGAPEIVAELGGDFVGGWATLEKQARNFTAEQKQIMDIAEKHGLPLMEFMIEDTKGSSAKITPKRKAAFEKELGMTTEEAINKIVEGQIPISKLRAEGKDLYVLEEEAYNKAIDLAKKNPTKVNTQELVDDIDREILRIKSSALSPSNAENAAIRVLENEKKALTNPPKKSKSQILDANGNPISQSSNKRTPKEATVEKLLEQTKKYNSNVKGIYKKAEFSGSEEEVRSAYAFLNDRIRNTVQNQAGKEVVEAHKAANAIFAQNASLARTEGLIAKAFPNGEFNAKKLDQLLNSKQGAVLRREIGQEGVKDLREIAEYGKKAQQATSQFANSSKHGFQISEWGPVAGFVLAKVPLAAAGAAAAKPMFDYFKGWVLTRPVARKTYAKILKNAANGSFSNMAKDFSTLENEIVEEFGSLKDFFDQGINDLPFYVDDED